MEIDWHFLILDVQVSISPAQNIYPLRDARHKSVLFPLSLGALSKTDFPPVKNPDKIDGSCKAN